MLICLLRGTAIAFKERLCSLIKHFNNSEKLRPIERVVGLHHIVATKRDRVIAFEGSNENARRRWAELTERLVE